MKNILWNHINFAEIVDTNSDSLGNFQIPVWYILYILSFISHNYLTDVISNITIHVTNKHIHERGPIEYTSDVPK